MDSSIGIIIAVAIAGFVVYKVFFNKDSNSASAPATSKPAGNTPVGKVAKADPKVIAPKAPSKAELGKLTKKAIDEKAAAEGIKLDARKTKAAMIKDFQTEVKKQLK
jgi:hypothetical protein